MFSSTSDEWSTPAGTFAELDREFGPFTLDPCATAANAKCMTFLTKEDDGLARPWSGRVFMNPPYGRQIGSWMGKAWEESRRGALVVCLVPSRTDTAWWHEFAMRGEIRFIRRRLQFIGPKGLSGPAVFGSAVVVFRPPA